MTGTAHEVTEIRTGRLLLRTWRAEDAGGVLVAFADPEIARWNGAQVTSAEEARQWIAARAERPDGDHASYAVVDLGGSLLGSVSVHHIDRDQGDAEIGYWTMPAARGRGVAVEAVVAASRWAFDHLPIDRIQLFHATENTASARVAAKAGFTQEGRLRQSYRYGDGRKHDELLWSLLRSDQPRG